MDEQIKGASCGSGSRERSRKEASPPVGFDPSRRIDQAIATMGRRIEARRKAMGLTLDQVATRAGMSKSYVWEIENGKNKNPTIRTAWQLAGALGWTLSECIGVWEHADLLHPEAMRIAIQVDILLRPDTASREEAVHGEPKQCPTCPYVLPSGFSRCPNCPEDRDSDGSGEAGETGTGSTDD